MDKLIRGVQMGQQMSRSRAPMAPIKFGEWLPDMPEIDNPGCVNVSNVIPFGPGGYKPFKDFSAHSTTATTARVLGAVSASGTSGAVRSFCGDTSKLYYLDGTVWTSGGSGFTLGNDENWNFLKAPNADTMLACAGSEDVQAIGMVGDNTFAAYFTSTLKPKPKYMAQVGSFLMLLNVDEGGTVYPDRVRWSSITDPADMDASSANQSDAEDLGGEYGHGQAIIGGETATIFLERAIFRASFVGSPAVFRLDAIETSRGLLAPGAIARLGRLIFYLAADGFFLWDGLESHPIGDRKVNQTFFDAVGTTYYSAISTAIDPQKQLFMVAYPTTSATGGIPDRLLMYHWPSGWWGEATVTTELIHTGLSPGLTLEELDAISTSLDGLPFSLDSPAWQGSVFQVTAFNSSHQSGTFTGATLAATIDTGIRQLTPGKQTKLTGALPIIDGGTPTIAVAGAVRMNNTFTFGSAVSQTTKGKCPIKDKNRFQKLRLGTSASDSWTHASGIQPIGSEAGGN
jgi:hypothetical protein